MEDWNHELKHKKNGLRSRFGEEDSRICFSTGIYLQHRKWNQYFIVTLNGL